ncbi:hypothetical protein CYMTET_51726 [Cymbomonas tetramitiformis]|uniref:Receptor ligand binding region domain-containing protein n=1 Tax=Cymbomonas tetramitiformis TaxID=36881 RepID=A0AAE0BLQ2_9CHLO|nr:hypothetical protein CYMTET_51726 [Cymbomonas tetramitiformis]
MEHLHGLMRSTCNGLGSCSRQPNYCIFCALSFLLLPTSIIQAAVPVCVFSPTPLTEDIERTLQSVLFAFEDAANRTDYIAPSLADIPAGLEFQVLTWSDVDTNNETALFVQNCIDQKGVGMLTITGDESTLTAVLLAKEVQSIVLSPVATSTNLNQPGLQVLARTIPNILFQGAAAMEFLVHMNWTKVACVFENSDYGRSYASVVFELSQLVSEVDIKTIMFECDNQTSVERAMEQAATWGARIFLGILRDCDAEVLLSGARTGGVLQQGYAWLLGQGFVIDHNNSTRLAELLNGTLAINLRKDVTGVQHLAERFQAAFAANETTLEVTNASITVKDLYAYDAGVALATAIGLVYEEQGNVTQEDGNKIFNAVVDHDFVGASGEMHFDRQAERELAVYDVYNFQGNDWVPVAEIKSENYCLMNECNSTVLLYGDIIWIGNHWETPNDGLSCPIGSTFITKNLACAITFAITAPYKETTNESAAGWSRVAAAAMLAVIHVNDRNDTVVPLASTLDDRVWSESQSSFGVTAMLLDSTETNSTNTGTRSFNDECLRFDNEHNGCAAVIGAAYSRTSTPIATLGGAYNVPQVSYWSTSRDLSTESNYPYFSRVITQDDSSGAAFAQLCYHFNWTTVAVLYISDVYGTGYANSFGDSARELGINVKTSQSFDDSNDASLTAALGKIADSGARVILAIFFSNNAELVLTFADDMGLVGPGFVWLICDGVADGNQLLEHATDRDRVSDLCLGMLRLATVGNSNTERFLNLAAAYREEIAGILERYPELAVALNLADEQQFPGNSTDEYSSIMGWAYDAVFAAAFATNMMTESDVGKDHWAKRVYEHLKSNVSFEGNSGVSINFDDVGDRNTNDLKMYLKNWAGDDGFTLTGYFTAQSDSEGFLLDIVSPIIWSDNTTEIPQDGFSCPLGYMYNTTTLLCTPCPAGSYLDEELVKCALCSPGTYSPEEGQTQCIHCYENSYAEHEGSTKCEQCPNNTKSNTRAIIRTECLCKTHFYLPEEGEEGDACEECPIGALCAGDYLLEDGTRVTQSPVADEGWWWTDTAGESLLFSFAFCTPRGI